MQGCACTCLSFSFLVWYKFYLVKAASVLQHEVRSHHTHAPRYPGHAVYIYPVHEYEHLKAKQHEEFLQYK